ncbi:MAG: hypothetical protein RI894_2520 [Bacteroidota bacterium]|jgi:uncharacterized protein YjdB
MAKPIATITNTLMNAPLPLLIEKLGMAIAHAQVELDKNSIKLANELAKTNVRIKDKDYNLLALGFTPTFYAFTEATVEAKISFSLHETFSFEVGGEVSFGVKDIYATTVSFSVARKFEQSAEGSSSIATRIISLPSPDKFKAILDQEASNAEIPITKIVVTSTSNTLDATAATIAAPATLALTTVLEPVNSTNNAIIWTIAPATADISISTTGVLSALKAATPTSTLITVKAAAKDNSSVFGERIITVNQ